MNIDQLRALWHERRGKEAPTALSKDLIARALAYWAQEERLGGLSPRLLRMLASVSNTGSHRIRCGFRGKSATLWGDGRSISG